MAVRSTRGPRVIREGVRVLAGSGGFRTRARRRLLRTSIATFLGDDTRQVHVVPFSVIEHDAVAQFLVEVGYFGERKLVRLHRVRNMARTIRGLGERDAVYIHGGNTFRLCKTLHENGLIEALREAAIERRVRMLGISAGANILGLSIATTNDNPVVPAPTLEALGLLRFNVKPHYVPGVKNVAGMQRRFSGESHDERIADFHAQPGNDQNVLGMWEGTILTASGSGLELSGAEGKGATLHRKGGSPIRIPPNRDITTVLERHQPRHL